MLLRESHLLVELSGTLLQLLLASRLAESLCNDRTLYILRLVLTRCWYGTHRCGLVVLNGCLAAAGGSGISLVHGVS